MSSSVLIVITIPASDRQNDLTASSGDKDSNSALESIRSKLEVALSKFHISDTTWQLNFSGTLWKVMFTCSVEESDGILEYLAKRCNIGSLEDTYVGIIPFSFYMKDELLSKEVFDNNYDTSGESEDEFYFYSPKEMQSNKKAQSIRCSPIEKEHGSSKRKDDRNEFKKFQERFLKSITARLTVAQVAASIKSGAELTFDFLLYIIMAAWIAAMGLMENSIVSLVASMLVSPLMGPGNSFAPFTFYTLISSPFSKTHYLF